MDIKSPSDIDISPYLNQLKSNCEKLRSDVKASRSVIVTIINHTNQILYRTNFHTSHGHWKIFPEEKINAHAFIHIVSESQGVLGSTEARAEFKMKESAAPFYFEWNNPYVGSKTAFCNGQNRQDGFRIDTILSHFDHSTELMYVVWDPYGRTNLPEIINPQESELWKIELARAASNVLVGIHNNTRLNMERINMNVNGKWRKEPPQFLTPGQYVEFGSGTHSGFGIEGHVTYKYIEGENKNSLLRSYNFIKVMWANKMGNSSYSEEKVDGFGGYYLTIEKRSNKNAVQWIITEKLADISHQPIAKNTSVQVVTNQLVNVPTIPQYNPQTQVSASVEERKQLEKDIIVKLNAKAEEDIPVIDNFTGINVYYHMAQNLWEQGNQAKKAGDLERAYLFYMRYTTFVLQKLPTHASYNLRFEEEKSAARAKIPKLLNEMEVMQADIVSKKVNEAIEARSKRQAQPQLSFPNVPPVPVLPTVPSTDPSQKNKPKALP